MSTIGRAFELALTNHKGQVDKNGEAYIAHVVRVCEGVSNKSENYQIVALLHDVVEDTSLTRSRVAEEFGLTIAQSVDAITKRFGESYSEYLRRVKQNPTASAVKVEDIKDNLLPRRLASLDWVVRERLMSKYQLAFSVLLED